MPSSTTISSTRHPLVRHVVRLRDNRFRQRDAAVLVDGRREIERAMSGGLALRSLFIADSSTAQTRSLVAAAGDSVVWVTPMVLGKIAYGDQPREAVAVFDAPGNRTLDALVLPADPLVVVLVGVEKPGNAGAVFRSADAVGADAVILCEAGCDLFNPNLIRSSLGTVFTMRSATARQSETIGWLSENKIHALAAIVGAPRTFWEVDYRGPTAIVLGSEAQGLGPQWRLPDPALASGLASSSRGAEPEETQSLSENPLTLPLSPAARGEREQSVPLRGRWPSFRIGSERACELTAVSIPMLGTADSLNVSVTAAALLFEARRQRGALSVKPFGSVPRDHS